MEWSIRRAVITARRDFLHRDSSGCRRHGNPRPCDRGIGPKWLYGRLLNRHRCWARMAGMAYNRAPYIVTWGMLEWWKPFAIILMLPASLLVVIGLTTPNPTAVAQENRLAQPPQGIVRVTRHPFLTGVGLWALVHLIGDGDVASLVFFTVWAVVALAGTVSIDRKRQRLFGEAWEPFAAQTSIVPFAAIAAGRNRFRPGEIGAWRWGAAVLVYVLTLVGHADVIGVSPFSA